MTSRNERYLALVRGQTTGWGASATRAGLWLASGPYAVGVSLRNKFYDRGWQRSVRASVPVLSVGNLTLGGTGKTPCVEYVARFYRERDVRVAILSRGYGGDGGPNDEALVLESNLDDVPHLQGPDRAALAMTSVEELESELLILDDGFQHRRLARDLDIVLVDATEPWGHGHIFPRGLMREPRSSLRRAHAVLMTRCDQAGAERVAEVRGEISRRVSAGTPIVETTHSPIAWQREGGESQPVDALCEGSAAAFCGLGHPEAFRATLASVGITPKLWRVFPDHHNYTRADVDDLRRWADSLPRGGVVLTTQKDAVKLRLDNLAGRPLWALRIGLTLAEGEDANGFHERLSLLKSRVS